MMKYLIYIIIAALFVIMQTSVLYNFSYFQVVPDLVLVLVLSLCFTKNFNEASIVAIIGGLFLDLFSAKSFGLSAIGLMVILLAYYLFVQSMVDSEKVYSRIWITAAASFIYFIIILGSSYLFDLMDLSANRISISRELIMSFFGGIAVNSLLVVIVYPGIAMINNYLDRKEKRKQIKI